MRDEHCILLAMPCGRDHMDVLQQSNNLRNGFINYLTSKQAAGIVNATAPNSQQVSQIDDAALLVTIANHTPSLLPLSVPPLAGLRHSHLPVVRVLEHQPGTHRAGPAAHHLGHSAPDDRYRDCLESCNIVILLSFFSSLVVASLNYCRCMGVKLLSVCLSSCTGHDAERLVSSCRAVTKQK